MTVAHATHGTTAGARKVSAADFTLRGYRFAITNLHASEPLWVRFDENAIGSFTAADAGDLFTEVAHGLTTGDTVFFERLAATTAFTAANAGDLFTSVGHGLHAAQAIYFSGASLPTGIVAGTQYYVIAANLTADTFQVSATVGGAAVVLTSDGSGTFAVDLPAGIAADTVYYIRAGSLTADAFTVATAAGGAAVALTSDGAGTSFRAPSGDNSTVILPNSTAERASTLGRSGLRLVGIGAAVTWHAEKVR